jgi:hypothetical protein
MTVAAGKLVQHASLGIGKIVAVEPNAVHVFFPEREKRFAAKLRWPAAQPLLKLDGVERNEWLEGLTSFALDPESGRYALASNFLTHEQAIADFLAVSPRGFEASGAGGRRDRRASWRAASAEWTQAFGPGDGERLVAAGDVRELVKRAVKIEREVVQVAGTFVAQDLKDALRDADAALVFFEALFGVLGAPLPGRARFEKLFAAAADLPAEPSLAWPLATLFPFVADPARHVFLWPKAACAAAERLGCDLRYDPSPTWATYAALRGLSTQLLEELRAHGARDFVDVEAFLHATAARRSAPAARRKR